MNQIAMYENHLENSARRPMTGDELTPQQKQAVGYFIRRLKLVSPAEFDRMVPSAEVRKEIQRDYAPYVKDFSRAHIDAGFDRLHTLRQQGDPEYKFLDIDKAIGLIQMAARQGVYSPRSGKFFIAKPDPEAQPKYLPDANRKTRTEAAREREMEKIRNLLGDVL